MHLIYYSQISTQNQQHLNIQKVYLFIKITYGKTITNIIFSIIDTLTDFKHFSFHIADTNIREEENKWNEINIFIGWIQQQTMTHRYPTSLGRKNILRLAIKKSNPHIFNFQVLSFSFGIQNPVALEELLCTYFQLCFQYFEQSVSKQLMMSDQNKVQNFKQVVKTFSLFQSGTNAIHAKLKAVQELSHCCKKELPTNMESKCSYKQQHHSGREEQVQLFWYPRQT